MVRIPAMHDINVENKFALLESSRISFRPLELGQTLRSTKIQGILYNPGYMKYLIGHISQPNDNKSDALGHGPYSSMSAINANN